MAAAALVLTAVLAQEPPLPEGNAFVRGLAQRHREQEQALNAYTYDVLELKEDLDKKGVATKRESRLFEVFYVRGRPLRRLVAEQGRPLPTERQAREDARVREKVKAILTGRFATEEAGLRISLILERYDFRAVAREDLGGRSAVVLDFSPLPGKRDLDSDHVLRRLAGRIWVDEAEREVLRAQVHNTAGIKFVLGLGASLSSLDFTTEFTKVDDAVWLPSRVEALAVGRMLLFRRFRTRTTATYSRYRRFQVESEEQVGPPPPPP